MIAAIRKLGTTSPIIKLVDSTIFNAIQRIARELVAAEYALWKDDIAPALARNGIRVHDVANLNAKRTAWAQRYFREEVFPMLTPLAVDASHPFPQLLNKSHNLLVRARNERGGEMLHAIVQVPRVLPRLILMPRGKGEDDEQRERARGLLAVEAAAPGEDDAQLLHVLDGRAAGLDERDDLTEVIGNRIAARKYRELAPMEIRIVEAHVTLK